MKVNEIQNLCNIEECEFFDRKGHAIPFATVIQRCSEWLIYAAPTKESIKIIAPENQAREFFRDLLGTCKGYGKSNLVSEDEICRMMNLSLQMTRAWMWSCVEYGLTQRECPYGSDEMLWVVE